MVDQVDCISPQRSKWWNMLCHVIISIIHSMHLLCIPIFYTTNHKSHSLSPPRLKTRSYHMREHKYTSYNSTSTRTVIIPHTHRTITLYVRSIISSNTNLQLCACTQYTYIPCNGTPLTWAPISTSTSTHLDLGKAQFYLCPKGFTTSWPAHIMPCVRKHPSSTYLTSHYRSTARSINTTHTSGREARRREGS